MPETFKESMKTNVFCKASFIFLRDKDEAEKQLIHIASEISSLVGREIKWVNWPIEGDNFHGSYGHFEVEDL